MDQILHLATLFYAMFAFCILFPIPVFVSCGLTVDSIFARFLGSEHDNFVYYHIKRSSAAVLFHSILPLGYVLVMIYVDPKLDVFNSVIWQTLLLLGVGLFSWAVWRVWLWQRNAWAQHPIYSKLRPFTGGHHIDLLINDINRCYSSPHKIIIVSDPTCNVISTANWLIKTSPYNLDIAHQSDVTLDVLSADNHEIAADTTASTGTGGVQFLKIRVVSGRSNVLPFFIRINSIHLKDLQSMLASRIRIRDHIRIQATLQDRFLTVFRNQVEMNPIAHVDTQLDDDCWGCCVKKPNVKLVKTCSDDNDSDPCAVCYCKPMWCLDCMALWFSSRQDQDKPQQWMSSKVSCPLCRSKFCVLDVCLIQTDPRLVSPTVSS